MNRPGSSRIWNVILAAGDGTRLAPLVRRLHGDDRPKQFAVLEGQRSLLQETVRRMSVVSERSVVVVAERHLTLARRQLGPGVELVGQPRNAGTGPGILLPLCRVLRQDPDAMVVISPSDHHFRRPGRFTAAIARAVRASEAAPAGICMLAVEAERPATDLGWIVPGQPLTAGGNAVRRFVEKPELAQARALLEGGALWNTFVMVGSAARFWELATRSLPEQVRLMRVYLEAGGPGERQALARIYDQLAPADFSRDVLARAVGLAVVAVDRSGWSDWGTPERLFESLRATPHLGALERRLSAAAP
jgi:mannose-1-phosphate guanylyltransferase